MYKSKGETKYFNIFLFPFLYLQTILHGKSSELDNGRNFRFLVMGLEQTNKSWTTGTHFSMADTGWCFICLIEREN